MQHENGVLPTSFQNIAASAWCVEGKDSDVYTERMEWVESKIACIAEKRSEEGEEDHSEEALCDDPPHLEDRCMCVCVCVYTQCRATERADIIYSKTTGDLFTMCASPRGRTYLQDAVLCCAHTSLLPFLSITRSGGVREEEVFFFFMWRSQSQASHSRLVLYRVPLE